MENKQYPTMISTKEAEQFIHTHMPAYPSESCALSQAHGRILREPIAAEQDIPPYDRVMMDGIAVDAQDTQSNRKNLLIQETQGAGVPPTKRTAPHQAIRIMTGAVLPEGCNCVIPCEEIDDQGNSVTIQPSAPIDKGQFIHSQGSDAHAGQILIQPGCLLNSTHISLAASNGKDTLSVTHPPSVMILSNGDELVELDHPMETHQIRPSNAYALHAALAKDQISNTEHRIVKDNPAEIKKSIANALDQFDMLILTGGVSMGHYDYISAALEDCGVQIVFHKIRQRPGKPFLFGLSTDKKPVFALPGNPVSTLVCYHRYIRPSLMNAMGMKSSNTLHHAITKENIPQLPGLTFFHPVCITQQNGTCMAKQVAYRNSGHYTALTESDGFIEIPEGTDITPAGTCVPFFRWK